MAEISTPPAATPADVLRRALELLDGRDVVAAIRAAAAGDEQLADAAFRELAGFIGYGLADPAGAVALWQDYMPEYEIRHILPRAADHAEREGR